MSGSKTLKTPLRVRETIPASQIKEALQQLSSHLIENFDLTRGDIALIGIQTRGVVIANRIAQAIKKEKHIDIPVGAIDITLYRDDVVTSGIQPIVGETRLDFDLDNRRIVLIDDVLFTGRTVRAALDELMDFGRPKSVSLIVLVDRGHRELPIEPKFAPIKIKTSPSESVNLLLEESDGREEIVVGEPIIR